VNFLPETMADPTELQANDLVKQRRTNDWATQAIVIYDQILSPAVNFKTPKDRIIICLLGRSECYLEIKNYENCIQDCRRLLKLLGETEAIATEARIRRRLIHALIKQKKYTDAENVCKMWIVLNTKNSDIGKILERYKTIIQIAANGQQQQKTSTNTSQQQQRSTQQQLNRLDEEIDILDTKLENYATNNLPPDKFIRSFMVVHGNGNKQQQAAANNSKLTNSTTANSGESKFF
jgi:tetratricopeptide (TPR) repeat protein